MVFHIYIFVNKFVLHLVLELSLWGFGQIAGHETESVIFFCHTAVAVVNFRDHFSFELKNVLWGQRSVDIFWFQDWVPQSGLWGICEQKMYVSNKAEVCSSINQV